MDRHLFEPEHILFRDAYRSFLEQHVLPFHAQWEVDGIVDRTVWTEAGKQGFVGFNVPEQYGGGGASDFRYNAIVGEENARAGATGLGFTLQNDVVAPYLLELATDEQKQRWLPPFAAGELISAIAMTEPGTGSDLQGIKTRAVREGDNWVINGAKTFITNGIHADLVIVVCRTDPEAGSKGFSLICVERGTPGFERGRNLDKMGMHAQDTAELSFSDVRVPTTNLLGTEGQGFVHLMSNLPQERLSIACSAVGAMESVLAQTLQYAKDRQAFGKPIGSFQHNRFLLAELATETTTARVFVDHCIELLNRRELSVADAAMAKWWTTELQVKLVDRCVQLHGGYGFMNEYPVAKAYTDSRVQTIYGSTTEIMKEIIGRSLGV
ncbi:MAG TPA: acyl-CoA dehydrogenase family protein [Mycobacteriales bacterium]